LFLPVSLFNPRSRHRLRSSTTRCLGRFFELYFDNGGVNSGTFTAPGLFENGGLSGDLHIEDVQKRDRTHARSRNNQEEESMSLDERARPF